MLVIEGLSESLLFFVPAAIANVSPMLANGVPLLKRWRTPLDFGKSFRGKRVLGDNKRWRGLIFGSVVACLSGILIYPLAIDSHSWVLNGLLAAAMGFGALLGDGVESFFKRRVSVPPGRSWFPFDQIDYIIGGLVIVYPFVSLPSGSLVLIFGFYFGIHLAFSYVGYLLKLKNTPI